jgi:ribosome-associated protein
MPRKNAAPLPKTPAADGLEWDLTDMGSIVVHLMSQQARDFYELERLWSSAERLK